MITATDIGSVPVRHPGIGMAFPSANRQWDAGRFRLGQIGVVAIPLIATLLRIASPPTSAAAYVVVAIWALTGRRQAVVSLFLCWLFNMASHAFCGPPLMAAILRYVVILCAALSVFARGSTARSTTKARSLIWTTLSILVVIIIHCFLVSPMLDISLLKAVVFSVAFMTALCGWAWMSPAERHVTAQTVFGGLVLVICCSLPMAFMSAGYMRRGNLFCGVLSHSQEFGMVAGVVATFLACQCLTQRPLSWWRGVVLLIALAEVFHSKARIGMLAFVVGMVAAFAYQIASNAMTSSRLNPRIVAGRIVAAVVLFGILLVPFGDQIGKFAADFINKGNAKGGEDLSLIEAGMASRGGLIAIMSDNIGKHPVDGIGFGIASDPSLFGAVVRDGIFGLPIMATVEKGVMPLMVIEELGIPIAVLVFLWMGALGICATRGGMVPVAVFASAMASNIAEATFFSPGGAGLLIIVLVCWAVTEPAGGAWKQNLRMRQAAMARSAPNSAPLSPLAPLPQLQALPAPRSLPTEPIGGRA